MEESTLDNFREKDNAYNAEAGIYELDKTAKKSSATPQPIN